MDIVRLNMDYYSIDEMEMFLKSIKEASEELGTACPIFIDLKGMLIMTLKNNCIIDVKKDEEVYIGDDPEMAGKFDDLTILDCPKFAAKLQIGDKIAFEYGTLELEVTGFISKAEYLKKKKKISEETK